MTTGTDRWWWRRTMTNSDWQSFVTILIYWLCFHRCTFVALIEVYDIHTGFVGTFLPCSFAVLWHVHAGDPQPGYCRYHETSSCSASGEAEFPEVGMSLVSFVLPGSEATAGRHMAAVIVMFFVCLLWWFFLILSNSRGNFDILEFHGQIWSLCSHMKDDMNIWFVIWTSG